jgi:hypothetical protein
MHFELDSLAVHPLHEVSKSRFVSILQYVFLCLAFDEIAIESGFKDRGVETCYLLMYDKGLCGGSFADDESNKFSRVTDFDQL